MFPAYVSASSSVLKSDLRGIETKLSAKYVELEPS